MVFVEKSKVVSWVLYFVFCLIMAMLSIKFVQEFWFCLTSDLSDQRYVDRHQVWRFFCLPVWNNLIIFVIITEQMRGIVEPPNRWNSLSINIIVLLPGVKSCMFDIFRITQSLLYCIYQQPTSAQENYHGQR